MSDHLDLKTASVDDLVDTATARLSEAEDALRELVRRDHAGVTRVGYRALGQAKDLQVLVDLIRNDRKRDLKPRPPGAMP